MNVIGPATPTPQIHIIVCGQGRCPHMSYCSLPAKLAAVYKWAVPCSLIPPIVKKTIGPQSKEPTDEVLKEFIMKEMAALQGQAKEPGGRSLFQSSNKDLKRGVGRPVLAISRGGGLERGEADDV